MSAVPAQHAPPAGPGLSTTVYELFPYGVMVVDMTGRIIAANRRAREILSSSARGADPALTCCGLLGCRRVGGPLEHCCITQVALQAGEPLPELRLDLPGAPTRALWVTASPLDQRGSAVILQMRPGSAGDRRARTRSCWLDDGPRLRISVLGELRVESRQAPLRGDWLDQRPGELLRFLVCERRRTVPTEEIAAAVWGQTGRSAPNTVRQFVHVLRERLEPDRPRHGESSFVVSRRGGYALNGRRVWIDVDQFEEEARRGRAALGAGDRASALEHLERAMELYRDDFLADDPYAEWAFAERERLRAVACDALRLLSELHGDEPLTSVGYLERLGSMEPFDNEVHHDLVAVLLRLGYRSRAVRHYQAFRRRLVGAFGELPDFELADLSQRGGRPGPLLVQTPYELTPR
jgi:DNA-binding SARP family transcriptional activator